MSTSSSSSSVEGGGDGRDFEGPSSSRTRMRSSNGVWPEPFLEALAFRVAVDASRTVGHLAAAQALSNLFQVCSTWRAISSSDLLWQNLTQNIWNIPDLVVPQSWREEYIHRHRTAANFRTGRYNYTTLHFVPTDNNNNNDDGLNCRRLALSDHHLAAGFSDGAVHLFHIPSRLYLSTFYPQHRDRLGRFSSTVSGIILSDRRLVFATLDGDIHMAAINAGITPLRRAHLGDVVNDGALVDFAGCSRWWIGLYAGVPGHAFHIWNGETEELVFIGGTLTDPEAVTGWHLLTEMAGIIGRIRVTNDDVAVACTGVRVIVFHLENRVVLEDEEFPRGIVVGSFDAFKGSALIRDALGGATVRRVADMEEVCRFTMMGGAILGCMNGGYGMTWGGGVIRVYGIENGEYLYSFRERIEECSALIADERYVAACCADDATIHLWDFEAQ